MGHCETHNFKQICARQQFQVKVIMIIITVEKHTHRKITIKNKKFNEKIIKILTVS